MRDFLENYMNADMAQFTAWVVIPVVALLVILVLRRQVPAIVGRFVKVLSRLSNITLRQDLNVTEDRVIRAFVPPFRLMITAAGVWAILQLYDLRPSLNERAGDIFSTLILIGIFWTIFRVIDVGFEMWYEHTKHTPSTGFNETIVQFLGRLAEAAVVIIGFVVLMDEWGYNLTGLLAGLGLGGLAIALAAQETLANLIGYFSLIADRPFDVGDYIVAKEFEGIVEEIGFRTTRIRRPDRALIYVPNRVLANEIVTNWSKTVFGPKRGHARLNFTLGLTYSTPPDALEKIVKELHDMLTSEPRVMPGSVVVNFVQFGASSLDILIVAVVRVSSWQEGQQIRQEINLRILRLLKAHELDVAYPTSTIVIEQGDGGED